MSKLMYFFVCSICILSLPLIMYAEGKKENFLSNEKDVFVNTNVQVATVMYNLSELINIKNLAIIIAAHANDLDDVTKAYVIGLGSMQQERAEAVERILSRATVYSGVDIETVKTKIAQYAPSLRHLDLDGFTANNCIVLKDTLPAKMNDVTANLLGHEAIHLIQAAAYGKEELFLAAYQAQATSKEYPVENSFEVAAYIFGGDAKSVGLILDYPLNLSYDEYWWKN